MERDERPRGAAATTTTSQRRPFPPVEGVRHRFVDLPGLRMHVAEAGAGDPVLLLHGSPLHWWEWHRLIPRLAGSYRVICPDLRGAGWTDAPPSGYTRDQILADVVALLDALGIDRVRLVSHDMGAIAGYGLCWDHPERVDRHVGMGVLPLFAAVDLKTLPRFRHLWHQYVLAVPGLGARLAGRGRQRVIRHMLGYPGGGWRSEGEMEVFLAPLREPDRARAKSAMYRRQVQPEVLRVLRGRYRRQRLVTPTMVLVGEDDPVFPPEQAERLLRDSTRFADHVEIAAVARAAHHLPAEAPDRVADLLLQFFAEEHGAAG